MVELPIEETPYEAAHRRGELYDALCALVEEHGRGQERPYRGHSELIEALTWTLDFVRTDHDRVLSKVLEVLARSLEKGLNAKVYELVKVLRDLIARHGVEDVAWMLGVVREDYLGPERGSRCPEE